MIRWWIVLFGWIAVCVCGTVMVPLYPKSHTVMKHSQSYMSEKDAHVVPLIGCVNVVFSTPITVGTQSFFVLVDTGSTTMAIAGQDCTTCNDADPTYVPGPTAQNLHQSVSAQYGSGSWSGNTYSDEVSFAGFSTTRLNFGVVTSASSFFINSFCKTAFNKPNAYQGILGLAYPVLASGSTQSYIDTVGLTVFAIQMCISSGRLWLGGFDTAYFNESALQYTPIIQEKWYVVQLTAIHVEGSIIPVIGPYPITLVDSGTSLFLLATPAYVALVAALLATPAVSARFTPAFFSQGWCQSVDGTIDELNQILPGLTLSLTGATLDLPAIQSWLVIQYGPDGSRYFCAGIDNSGSTTYTIMGYAVMNNFVTVFDRTNAQIGFAPSLFCDQNGPDTNTTDWYAGPFSDCANCTASRLVECVDNHGTAVNSTLCDANTEPALTENCCFTLTSKPLPYLPIPLIFGCIFAGGGLLVYFFVH